MTACAFICSQAGFYGNDWRACSSVIGSALIEQLFAIAKHKTLLQRAGTDIIGCAGGGSQGGIICQYAWNVQTV